MKVCYTLEAAKLNTRIQRRADMFRWSGNRRVLRPTRTTTNAAGQAMQSRESRREGRPIYNPVSYQDICLHAYQSVLDGLDDGLRLMEVEFPSVPGEDASYKAASDVYIDLNIQYALTIFNKVYRETGKTCEILVPDGPEYRRAKKVFLNSLELSEGCLLYTSPSPRDRG